MKRNFHHSINPHGSEARYPLFAQVEATSTNSASGWSGLSKAARHVSSVHDNEKLSILSHLSPGCPSPPEINESKSLYMNLGHKNWLTQGWMSPLRDETVFLLNASPQEAHLEVFVYYSDRDPVGPYCLTVPARRMKPLRFAKLADPEPIPHATDYASTIESDVPIVVQSLNDAQRSDDALVGNPALSDALMGGATCPSIVASTSSHWRLYIEPLMTV